MTVTDDWTPSYGDNTESSIQNCNGDQHQHKHQHKHSTSITSNTSNNNKTIVYTNIEEDSGMCITDNNTVTITGTTATNKSTINNTMDEIYNTDNDSPNHSPVPVDSLPEYTSHSVVLSTDTTASITVPQTVTDNCTLIHNDDNNKVGVVTEQTIQWTR